MFVCRPKVQPPRLSDHDKSLRASSSHFKRRPQSVAGDKVKKREDISQTDCCKARIERIKLHSGYYPAATHTFIPQCTRDSFRCLIVLGKSQPPSRCSSRNDTASLRVFLNETDERPSAKKSTGVGTTSREITVENFEELVTVPQVETTPLGKESDQEEEDLRRDLADWTMTSVIGSGLAKNPWPCVDMEPLWKKKSDQEISEHHAKVGIFDWNVESINEKLFDKYVCDFIFFLLFCFIFHIQNIVKHMGSTVDSMSSSLKALMNRPQDFMMMTRFVQVLKHEKATKESEQNSRYHLPMGDHLLNERRKEDKSKITMEENEENNRPTRSKTPSETKRPTSRSSVKQQRPFTSRPKTPIESLSKTQSPVIVSRLHQRQSRVLVTDERDTSFDFKGSMCG